VPDDQLARRAAPTATVDVCCSAIARVPGCTAAEEVDRQMGSSSLRSTHHRRLALLAPLAAAVLASFAFASSGNARAAGSCSSPPTLPFLTWSPVGGADHYQVQVSADSRFRTPVVSSVFGDPMTSNTRATLTRSLPAWSPRNPIRTYWWRVRSATKSGRVSTWRTSSFCLTWSAAPSHPSFDGAVLQWQRVPGAASYAVEISLDPQFSTLIGGQPATTAATSYAIPAPLAARTYYWRVTPHDAEGNAGRPSPPWTFRWKGPGGGTQVDPVEDSLPTGLAAFPSSTPDQNYLYIPRLRWNPIPGAVKYEVEINSASDWSAGSRVCCDGQTVATSLVPPVSLLSNTYYWRVRGIDGAGNAGPWVPEGSQPSFTKTFDNNCRIDLSANCVDPGQPSIPNLTVLNADSGAPIVHWDAIPGASSYEFQVVPSVRGVCEWQSGLPGESVGVTATTAWTPLTDPLYSLPLVQPPFPLPPNLQLASSHVVGFGWEPGTYCFRVRARTERASPTNADVVGDYTNPVTLTFADHTATGGGQPAACSPNCVIAPGGPVGQMPVLEWNPVPGAAMYWVIIAKDPSFTNIVDYALSAVPAYAPRKTTNVYTVTTYPDESTKYYWSVIPADQFGRCLSGCPPIPPLTGTFDKQVAPALMSAEPLHAGDRVPTFNWQPVPGARRYELQVSVDPNFGGTPLDDVITVATSYTATRFYPSKAKLYWRVRALDENLIGLTWSDCIQSGNRCSKATVDENLDNPPKTLAPVNSYASPTIPALRWAAIPGAASYDVQIDPPASPTMTFSRIPVPAFTPTSLRGIGKFKWRVRAEYGQFGSAVAGAFSRNGSASGGWSTFTHTALGLPTDRRGNGLHMQGVGSGHALLLKWPALDGAKSYTVQISSTPDFSRIVETVPTDATSYAPNLGPAYRGSHKFYWHVAVTDGSGNTGSYVPARNPFTAGVH
jgi:hypothetical protein